MRHQSVWQATADPTSYPSLNGDLDADVVVVGAGLVGLTTALLVRRTSGRKVAVLEANRVSSGTTGGHDRQGDQPARPVLRIDGRRHDPAGMRSASESRGGGVTVTEPGHVTSRRSSWRVMIRCAISAKPRSVA